MSDLSERLRYCADSPCVGEPELRDLLREAAAALAKREPQIECPACGAVVKQVASATLGLELWQHWNWVCSYRQQAEARVSALQRENEELKVWKEDVIDAAIVHWTYDKSHTPREAINALMAQAYREALDPAVSEEAYKLVVRAEKAERENDEIPPEASGGPMGDLRPWLRHHDDCNAAAWEQRARHNKRPACTCGLDAALSAEEPVNWKASYHRACDDADAYKADAEARVSALQAELAEVRAETSRRREVCGLHDDGE